MAKRGDSAREAVKNTIINAFGANYVATIDKKIYVEAQDGPGGETIQFAITMTMPKTSVSRGEAQITSIPADVMSAFDTPSVKLSPDDEAKVADLMLKLGLS